ncbi:peptidoglycan DD-metalloendopeptidase family protein [Peribacillus sp. SCS-26]|uniref:peptidoglycan DD-metalloendopeptidase family protein n=1 Tax=Paraperibacillus marinus TaxID=3115295 RepID=UPI0039059B76
MKSRQKEIRDRIAKRRKQEGRKAGLNAAYRKAEGIFDDGSYEMAPEADHPLFKKEVFYFKILASLCLFLLTAIIFKNPSSAFEVPRKTVSHYMKEDFEFAAAKDWYQDTFGKPLVFLPEKKETVTAEKESGNYSLPASGKIEQTFEANGQGIMIETDKDSPVESAREGVIIFAGSQDKLGRTVVIQHSDKSETWYGHLGSIDVKLYETVKKGNVVGRVTNKAGEAKGTFYLAVKKGSQFVDPKQVIPFE